MDIIKYNNMEKVRVSYNLNNDYIDFNVFNTDCLISRMKLNNENFDFKLDYNEIENSGKVKISGWSLDFNYSLPPKSIFIFEENKLVKIIKSMGHRPDVSFFFKTFVDYLGFEADFNKKNDKKYKVVFIRPDDTAAIFDLE